MRTRDHICLAVAFCLALAFAVAGCTKAQVDRAQAALAGAAPALIVPVPNATPGTSALIPLANATPGSVQIAPADKK